MSVVTTVILFCHAGEMANLSKIESWLSERNGGMIRELNDSFGGNKHPEIGCYGGAYNMFDNDGFVDLFMSLTWDIKEEVLLVTRPQDSAILVYRPT